MKLKVKGKALVAAGVLGLAGFAHLFKSSGQSVSSENRPVRILETFWPKFHTDPKSLRTAGDWVGLQNLYSNLVEIKGSLDVRPDLAESWVRSPDGLTWYFKLRAGLKWSDGTAMTADQVVASLMRAYPGTTHTRLNSYVDAIVSSGDLGVEFRLKEAPDNFLVMLSYVDLAIVHPSAATADGFSWNAPSSGPYRARILSDDRMDLTANKYHWNYSKEIIPEIRLSRSFGDHRDVEALMREDFDACHIGAGIVDESEIKDLSEKYTVLTGDSDFLASLFFSSKRVKMGEWPESLRKAVFKNVYKGFWKSNPKGALRASGLRPAGTRGSLSFNEFDEAMAGFDEVPSAINGKRISLLVQKKHSARGSFLKSIDILESLGAAVTVLALDRDEYHRKYDSRDFDLAFQLLGASEGDPDSAWRIYNDDFALPVATEPELNRAQLEKDSSRREQLYKEFERRAIEKALYIPLKNEVTYIVLSGRVFLDVDLSSDWGLKLSKLRFK
jgi:ABC-type oligopeptide transport system substrate-binding subunit